LVLEEADMFTRQPRTTADVGLLASAFCAGMACGAGLMYLIAPETRRHNGSLPDQMERAGDEIGAMGDKAKSKAEDVRDRAQDTAKETSRNVSEFAGTGN
jgi:hypothetical protein